MQVLLGRGSLVKGTDPVPSSVKPTFQCKEKETNRHLDIWHQVMLRGVKKVKQDWG